MKLDTRMLLSASLLTSCSLLAWTRASDDAPSGTVSSTAMASFRRPITNLPFTVTQCGSYFLARCLTGSAGQNGITIQADDVTIDLNGFSLTGVPGSLDGISVPAPQENLTIFGGKIRDWDGNGVDAANVSGGRYERIDAVDNGQSGLLLGQGSSAVRCIAARNGLIGFVGSGVEVLACAAVSNANTGIFVLGASLVADCTVSDSSVLGINAPGGSRVTGNVCSMNGIAIQVGSNCYVQGNTLRGAVGSIGIGIAGDRSRIVDNSCAGHTVGGILLDANAEQNHLEGNTIVGSAPGDGIDVAGTGNCIIGNRATGNATDYDIVAGNAFGQIVDVTGIANFANSQPTANLSY